MKTIASLQNHLATVLAGAILALTETHEERIGEAMASAIRDAGTRAQWMPLHLDPEGAKLL
ncbi:hypothetical protein [Armatimonas sp.]|uniref:hypothetical protein n=1 Tax=Armatimonas sp. TaxID=1872638 RepID=UPI00286D5552|nr:hypothetical protein [Armatimonas sp.]